MNHSTGTEYIAAFDLGTTNTKAVLTDTRGEIVVSTSVGMTIERAAPGYAEQRPEDWWQALVTCCRALMAKADARPEQVVAISFSTQAMSVTPVDGRGEPLLGASPIWMDARAASEADRIRHRFGGSRLAPKIFGGYVTGNYSLPKMLWIKHSAPDVYRRTSAMLDQGGYLCLRATGEYVADWTQASGTGLFDLHGKHWSTGAIQLMGLDPGRFPRTIRPSDSAGGLGRAQAAELGLLQGTPVFPGALDEMATIVGTGTKNCGDAAITLGTSGNFALLEERKQRPTLGFANGQSADPGKLIFCGTTNAAGLCMDWAANHLYSEFEDRSDAFAQLERDVTAVPTGSDGIMFAPWLAGERSPYADENLRGTLLNLQPGHRREHIARAVAEGVAYNFALMRKGAETATGRTLTSVRIAGGGARNHPWMQAFADCLGLSVEIPVRPDLSAVRGAALIGAVGLGVYGSVADAAASVQAQQRLEPDPGTHAVYAREIRRYEAIYPALKHWYALSNGDAPASAAVSGEDAPDVPVRTPDLGAGGGGDSCRGVVGVER